MTVTGDLVTGVVGGADTHADTIHIAAIDTLGRELGDKEFPTTPAGYRAALKFLAGFGPIECFGIEGTSSFGAGLTIAARAARVDVREVIRPQRTVRRMKGKSDPIDAYQAARSVLSGQARTIPKTDDVDAVRALLTVRRSAAKGRTAAMNQIHSVLVTAPVGVREKYRPIKEKALVSALAACRPGTKIDVSRSVLSALKLLAQRHQFLTAQTRLLDEQLRALVAHANLALLSTKGVGPVTGAQLLLTAGGHPDRLASEASFAALCGTAPVPASSGKTVRYRLSRGGDRHANNALHTIATVRMASDPRTRVFVASQRAKGRSNPEIIRILKRAIAREIYKLLSRPNTVAGIEDLRQIRQAKNIPLSNASRALQTYPIHISRIERGLTHDLEFTNRYRAWLSAA